MQGLRLLIYLILILPTIIQAQNSKVSSKDLTDLQNQIGEIQDSIKNLDSTLNEIRETNQYLNYENRRIKDSLQASRANMAVLQEAISENEDELGQLKKELSQTSANLNQQIEQTRAKSEEQFGALNQTVNAKWLYGIIAFLLLALLAVIGYLVLNKKVHNKEQHLGDNIAQTRKELEEEAIRLDERLVQTMESQLKLMQESQYAQGQSENEEQEQDHSLALKVADEIVRIEKNLGKMDENTKGLKQLSKAVQRIKDNFAASGYEMVELLNKPFDERMKATIVNTIPDDNLNSGEQIISRIIKPQVNYNGEMIQAAQVEVSVG